MGNNRGFKKKILLLFIYVLLGGISMHLFFNRFINNKKNVILSPISHFSRSFVSGNKNNSESLLKKSVEDIIKNSDATFGIVIKNLKTGESYNLNENRIFETASLYKIWVMATVYDKLKQGSIKKEDILEEEITVLNEKFRIATESAEKTEGKIQMTVNDALEQMITVSDNYSALLLTAKIRLRSVDAFLKNHGFISSKVGLKGEAPRTSVSDIALFFEKLYKGELAEKEHTDEMIELLKKQRLNNKLPKYLPDGVSVAHKTGELDPFTHDGGIVYSDYGNYIIVVLTESQNRFETEEQIAKISKTVYDYFENTKK